MASSSWWTSSLSAAITVVLCLLVAQQLRFVAAVTSTSALDTTNTVVTTADDDANQFLKLTFRKEALEEAPSCVHTFAQLELLNMVRVLEDRVLHLFESKRPHPCSIFVSIFLSASDGACRDSLYSNGKHAAQNFAAAFNLDAGTEPDCHRSHFLPAALPQAGVNIDEPATVGLGILARIESQGSSTVRG